MGDGKQRPNQSQMDRAKALLENYGGSTKNKNSLSKRVERVKQQQIILLTDWIKENHVEVGLSRTSIDKRIKCLKQIVDGKELGSFDDIYKPGSFDDFLLECELTYSFAIKYINDVKQKIQPLSDVPSGKKILKHDKPSGKGLLNDTKWYAYFLHHVNENGFTDDINEAILARGIMHFTKDEEGEYIVEFTNIDSDETKYYRGHYETFMKTHRGYVFLNMRPKYRDEYGRHIHTKLYCNDKNQDILTGQYLSYEQGLLQSGNIIYKKIPENDTPKDPKAYSFYHNWEEYNKEILPVYRQFLANRKTNFNVLNIDTRINTEKALEKYVNSYRDSEKKRFERFLERPQPKVFLSTPNSLNHLTLVGRLKEYLDDVFQEKLKVSFKKGDLPDHHDTQGSLQPYMDIEKLKTTRYFVLILDDNPNKLSYSFLQLGMAVMTCKVVIVIGKKEYLTPSILKMKPEVIKKIIIHNNMNDEFERISQKLTSILKHSLPNHLGGNIADMSN